MEKESDQCKPVILIIIFALTMHRIITKKQNTMLKKIYKVPETDTLNLRMECPLCTSVDITDNNDISINDVTETIVSVDWSF